jgi:ABC-type branched-subunit amino acid transport system ATPase component
MVMQQGQTVIQDVPEKVRQNNDVQQAYLGDE